MTYAPATLVELGRYYVDAGGVNLGIVGDPRHTIGYHLGRDRIFDGSGPGIGAQDYSVQHARDVDGLSDAAAAIDFGRLNGSLVELYRFSRELVAACMAGEPGARDVREVIYSPDGVKVQRWSGIDNAIHTGPGNGDASHIGHTHVSYFRDSEQRSKLALIAAILGGTMQAGITNDVPKLIDVPKGADLLDLDGKTKLDDLASERLAVKSPYGRGSELRGTVRYVRREFAIDLDGSGPDRRRTVLVWLPESRVHDVPDPAPEPGPPAPVAYELRLDGELVAGGVHPSP